MADTVRMFKMKSNDVFNINNFLTPDVSCAPVYIWVWNDACTKEIIDTQLNEMQNLGIRAFYILPEPKDFRPGSMPQILLLIISQTIFLSFVIMQ